MTLKVAPIKTIKITAAIPASRPKSVDSELRENMAVAPLIMVVSKQAAKAEHRVCPSFAACCIKSLLLSVKEPSSV
jgi:hypothetical protein